ncbi:MAG: hypothetical protein KIT84_34135 [Labilithrix sp.]|nr:hypothetical protein [Labilithrix sp.]MCW5816086.1 hypothetical protein [Labilithrix sp.]
MARVLWLLVAAMLAASLAATLWFVVRTLPVRVPYWGEAEVVFEASRLRAHEPLFVDPLVGATERGLPPSRWYVTYPPLWSWGVSFVPQGGALIGARVASTLAWFGALGWLAWLGNKREAAVAAAFVAGVWVLANFATTGRPDSIAAAVAAVALVRATRGARIDPLTIALFVLVPWLKPTMIGLPFGALVAARDRRALAIAAGLALASAAIAHVASGGALFHHVVRSNAQPFTLAAWLDQVPARLPFFAPLFAWAAWLGWRERASASMRIALGALAASVAWTLVALAKTGSSSNYWMEPCVAAVVVVVRARPSPRDARFAAAALAATAYAGVASIRGALEHAATYRADAETVQRMSALCNKSVDEVVAADEAGIELLLDGRILVPTYQMVHLVRRGDFPAAPWAADLGRARCFIEHTGQLRLVPELARAIDESFVLVAEERGHRLYKR